MTLSIALQGEANLHQALIKDTSKWRTTSIVLAVSQTRDKNAALTQEGSEKSSS